MASRRWGFSRRRGGAGLAVLLATVLGAAASPAPVWAQQPDTVRADTTVYRLEGIQIRAPRPVTTVGGASAVEVRVDSLGLPPAPTMEEVLRELPGLHTRTNSRGQAEISVRGSESRQVAVLLDGVPLTLGWDGRTDASVLPAGAVQEVSLVRGLSTVLHGPNVLGGVVEMSLTGARRPTESSAVSLGVDHLGGYAVAWQATEPWEHRGGSGVVRAGLGFRDTPGVPRARGVTEPVEEAGGDLRLNTDFENLDGFFAFRYASEDGAWGSVSAAGHAGERGIAAELGADNPRLWRYPEVRRAIAAVSGGTGQRSTPWGRGDLEASVGVDMGRTEIRSFATRAYDEVVGSEDGDEATYTVRLLGDHTLGGRADLRAAATFADIHRDEVVDGDARSFHQRMWSLGSEAVVRVVEDPDGPVEGLRLSVGGVYDRSSTPETGGLEPLGTLEDWGLHVGMSALARDGNLVVHAGASRRARFPALREAFSEAIQRFVPNPGLRPEHLLALEGGVTARLPGGEVQAVLFHHRLGDAIRRVTLPGTRLRQRINSEELRSTGVELLVSRQLSFVGLHGDLVLQSVELTDPVARTSSEPENLPSLSGSLEAAWPLASMLVLETEAEYTGAQYCQDPDSGADVRLGGGAWWNAALRWVGQSGSIVPGRRMEARLSVNNLFDRRLYDQCGLPRPGRLAGLQIRVF